MSSCHHPIPLPYPFFLTPFQLSGGTDFHPVSIGLQVNKVKVGKDYVNEISLKDCTVYFSKESNFLGTL